MSHIFQFTTEEHIERKYISTLLIIDLIPNFNLFAKRSLDPSINVRIQEIQCPYSIKDMMDHRMDIHTIIIVIIFNSQRMHCRATVVILSVCFHEICCLPRLYVEKKVS